MVVQVVQAAQAVLAVLAVLVQQEMVMMPRLVAVAVLAEAAAVAVLDSQVQMELHTRLQE